MNIGRIIPWVVIAILVLLLMRSCSKSQEQEALYEATQDSLHKSTDLLGREFSVIMTLKGETKKSLLELKTKDSTIQWLQSSVENFKGKLNSAVVLSNRTVSSGSTRTVVTHDTVYVNDGYSSPIYSSSWDNNWEVGWIKATQDSIQHEIKIRNEFEITLGEVKNGFLKPKKSVVSVKNLNPNTITEELRSFEITHEPKRIGLGLHAGVGLGANLQPTPYVGIGLDFRLISIK